MKKLLSLIFSLVCLATYAQQINNIPSNKFQLFDIQKGVPTYKLSALDMVKINEEDELDKVHNFPPLDLDTNKKLIYP